MADEPILDDLDELLLRQVHPTFMRDGRPSSQAFRPTKKDEGKLSVARSALTDPKAAYEHHTQKLHRTSAGTWAVTVLEARAAGLQARPDPLTSPPEPVADPAHAVVDFRGLSNSQVEAKGLALSRAAHARGPLYQPDSPPPAST